MQKAAAADAVVRALKKPIHRAPGVEVVISSLLGSEGKGAASGRAF
jgi:hypothetical protein